VHVTSENQPPFWSVSIYNRRGENIFSLNDRIATERSLDILVLTPLQLVEVKKDPPEEVANSVFAEAAIDEGFMVLRAFVPDASFEAQVRQFIKGSNCEQI
jgi:uncharacterized membrane protein